MNLLQRLQLHKSEVVAFVVPFTALLIVCRAFPVLSFFYEAVPFLLAFGLAFANKEILSYRTQRTTILLLIAFGTWAATTSAWSPYPKVSLTRAAYFLLISISSLLLGCLWRLDNKNDLFGFLLPANILIVLVSLYSLFTSSPEEAWTGGNGLGFMGYAAHQNTLAAALVFTVPSILYPLLREAFGRVWKQDGSTGSEQLPKLRLSLYILVLLLNLCFLFMSGSRAGMLTLIIMALLFVLLNFRLTTSAAIFLLSISIFAVLVYVSQPMKDFVFKTEDTFGDRRIINIMATVEAATTGGVFGIGYGISEIPSDPRTRGHCEGEKKRFVREKMIGALALIEETGIIGLLLFLLPILYVLSLLSRKCFEASRQIGMKGFTSCFKATSVIAVLVALVFHAQIEAWWIGVGSVQLPIFYLILSSEFRIET